MSESTQRFFGMVALVVMHLAFCFWLGGQIRTDVASGIAVISGVCLGSFIVWRLTNSGK